MIDPLLNAADFRRMIITDLPELSPRLHSPEAAAHSDAKALLSFAVQALKAGDVDLTVRIFALARRLNDSAKQFDAVSQNALLTEFCRPIGSHSAEGIEIFRQIDPRERRELYCPFVLPHTLFENGVLDFTCSQGVVCTIAAQAEKQAKRIQQSSSVDHVCDVTLRLSPGMPDTRLLFENAIPVERDVPLWVIEEARDEVIRRLRDLCRKRHRLLAVTFTLVDAHYHAVDTRKADVAHVAGEAFGLALEAAKLKELS